MSQPILPDRNDGKTTAFEDPQSAHLNRMYPSGPSLLSTGISPTIYTPDATTCTASENGQPRSMPGDVYQYRHSPRGSLSSFPPDANSLFPAFHNDFTSQSSFPNAPSDVSTQRSSGNLDSLPGDYTNNPTQEYHFHQCFGTTAVHLSVEASSALNHGSQVPMTDIRMSGNVPLSYYFNTPASSSEPWTPLGIPNDRKTNADELVFAPDLNYDPGGNEALRGHPMFCPTEGIADNDFRNLRHRGDLQPLRVSPEVSVDKPWSANTVGPPNLKFDNSAYKVKKTQTANRKGRRHRGLSPQSREQTGMMRKLGGCWHCKVMRYKCDGALICGKCKAMRSSSFPWGCIRFRLPDLVDVFLPGSLINQHQEQKLREFAHKHVHSWTNNFMTVYVTWGHPSIIPCEVQEIIPQGDHLCFQNQYKLNLAENRYERVLTPSPPLGIVLTLLEDCSQKLERSPGMMLMSIKEYREKLDGYLDDILEHSFHDFPEHCFRGPENEVQRDLLYSFYKYYKSMAGTKEMDLPKVSLKLVIISKIMMHSLTLVESTKEEVFRKMRHQPSKPYGIHTSPRWLNKQLKFLLSNLHHELLTKALDKLHMILGTSRKPKTWGSALTGLIMLAITTEATQMTIRCKEATDKIEKLIPEHNENATQEIKTIEERWSLLKGLYHRGHLKDPIHNEKDRENVDAPSQRLAIDLKSIIEKHRYFLESKKHLPPPSDSCDPHSSRLVASFLLCSEGPAASP